MMNPTAAPTTPDTQRAHLDRGHVLSLVGTAWVCDQDGATFPADIVHVLDTQGREHAVDQAEARVIVTSGLRAMFDPGTIQTLEMMAGGN